MKRLVCIAIVINPKMDNGQVTKYFQILQYIYLLSIQIKTWSEYFSEPLRWFSQLCVPMSDCASKMNYKKDVVTDVSLLFGYFTLDYICNIKIRITFLVNYQRNQFLYNFKLAFLN